MSKTIKIAIVGDFNFAYNAHHATNLALDHAAGLFEEELNYYWIRPSEILNFKRNELDNYHGIWLAPGPYLNDFHLSGVINSILYSERPTLITGEGFVYVINHFVNKYQLNPKNEKSISDNLVSGNQFETIMVQIADDLAKKLYENHNTLELTATRYAIYPNLVEVLQSEFIEVEARDQFEEVQLMRLKSNPNTLVSMYLPQVSSTRDIPHPVVNDFVRKCMTVEMV
jgi:CTP synthase (UTP-ammonia lyase)